MSSLWRHPATDNKEWFTPPAFLRSVREVLGDVALDPCSGRGDFVAAGVKYRLPKQDGLKLPWSNFDTVFCNPPYGRDKDRGTSIRDWLCRCSAVGKLGVEVIALVPVAPNTRHWNEYVFPTCRRICFIREPRFKFEGAGVKGAPMAVAAIYWGRQSKVFEQIFSKWGYVARVSAHFLTGEADG